MAVGRLRLGPLPALPTLLLGVVGCSSGPGTFDLELQPSELTIAASVGLETERGDVDVLVKCGTNRSRFVFVLSVEGVPDNVTVVLPPGSNASGINCGSGDPPPAPMMLEVGQADPGTYQITLIGRNFKQSDILLEEPGVVRRVTLTLNVTIPAQ